MVKSILELLEPIWLKKQVESTWLVVWDQDEDELQRFKKQKRPMQFEFRFIREKCLKKTVESLKQTDTLLEYETISNLIDSLISHDHGDTLFRWTYHLFSSYEQ